MRRLLVLTALAFTAISVGQANADPLGDWRVADGNATVRIRKCGADFCGFVASTRSAPGKDERNPDPSKRSRSVIGIEVLMNLKSNGSNSWAGTTYNAEDGLFYTATVSMQGEQALQIKGCGPNGGVCGSETWTRVK
jgi:uncharacterized protein (DUF2147 family)